MGLAVVTGGARSGKSTIAEGMALRLAAPVTVAVFGKGDGDAEMSSRIERHKAARPEEWLVVEARDSVEWTERVDSASLLVDCLGTLLGLVMGEVLAEMTDGDLGAACELSTEYEAEVERRFAAIVGWLVKREGDTVLVTNEVGDGIVPSYATGRVFRDVLGRANRSVVARADRAYLVVAGRVINLTDLPSEAPWPRR